ncbi:helix-turn-helix domain-containing protein [Herbiconiux sp. P17]|uniref:helix-turn-helix domain-containing protein n=1 Tax=Herbiconiux wuyangfengii TaxID=3342794 RepID=UPI0035BAF571
MKRSLKHGWSFENQPALYEFDEMGDSDFGFARLWSGGMRTALSSREGLVHVVALVEGSAEMSVEGHRVPIEAGQIFLVRGHSALEASSPNPFARYGWFFRRSFLEGREFRHAMGEPMSVPRESLLALTSVANAAFGGKGTASKGPSRHVRIAMEHLVAAALAEPPKAGHPDPVHRDSLFLVAQTTIRERFRDPAFSVEALGRDLAVSPSSLYRAYASMGFTPRREIEGLRVAEAKRRLASIEQGGPDSPAAIASDAGFTSVAQMRRSLARRASSTTHDDDFSHP